MDSALTSDVLAVLEKDAARYRFLRDGYDRNSEAWRECYDLLNCFKTEPAHLDAAIDAALGTHGAGEG